MKTIYLLKLACIFLSMYILTTTTGCTKNFEEYNTDNTGFTEEQKAYDFNTYGILFGVIQQGIYFNYDWGSGKNWPFQIMQNLSADMFCGYFHNYKPFEAGLTNTVYFLNDSWNGSMWENTYGYILTEIKKTEDISKEEYPDFYGIAKILKVLAMHRISDFYGPIIYSRFGDSSTGSMPDSQKDAYYAFFDDLEEAIVVLKNYKGRESFAQFDILMPEQKKTYEQWLKFANSLRLRLAIRIAMADPEKARSEALKSFDPSNGGLLSKKDEIIAVSTAGSGYNNPLGEINISWKEVMMNANMESILAGYDDPRLHKYFYPATGANYKGEYRGIRQGTGFNHTRYSEHATSTITQYDNAPLLTPAEVWFLRAEAALRGWTSENAGNCYRQGIELSFDQWLTSHLEEYLENENIPADFIDTFNPEYSITAVSKVSPKWEEDASDEIKLEKIITQKWIALYPEGCEAWAEQRRTGYPRLFPVLMNRSNGTIDTETMIRRLNFPVGIISANPTQYEALCKELGGADHGGTRLWWDTGRNF